MTVLALCHHSLGPKVMCWLLWSRGLTKGPAAEESPQPAQASELHVGVWQDGDSVCSDPQTGPHPREPPPAPGQGILSAQEPISGQTFPLAERLKPLLAQLNSRQDKSPCTHLNARNGICTRNPSLPCGVLWWMHSPAPGLRGSPCPAPFCRGSSAVPIPAKPAAPLRRAWGGGNLLPGTMTVYSADHKPNPLWFLIGIWAKLI